MSKADAIRKAKKVNSAVVPVNEWKPDDHPQDEDYVLHVRSLSPMARREFEQLAVSDDPKAKDPAYAKEKILKWCVYDDEAFTVATFADFSGEEINELNPVPVQRLYDVAFKLSGLTGIDIEKIVGN